MEDLFVVLHVYPDFVNDPVPCVGYIEYKTVTAV